jgi:hypothetical protein
MTHYEMLKYGVNLTHGGTSGLSKPRLSAGGAVEGRGGGVAGERGREGEGEREREREMEEEEKAELRRVAAEGCWTKGR